MKIMRDHKPPTTASIGRDRANVTRTRAFDISPRSRGWRQTSVVCEEALLRFARRGVDGAFSEVFCTRRR